MEISVIICTYNRSKFLLKVLESLQGQDTPEGMDWEILVVDNNSTDNTIQVVEDFRKRCKVLIRYVFEVNQGLSHARNRGIIESQGDYVVFTDDDAITDKNWLRKFEETFTRYRPDCVGGKIHLNCLQKMPRWLTKDLWGFLGYLDYGNKVFEMSDERYPFGGNIAFRKAIFREIGFFNVELGRKGNKTFGGEEKELFDRIINSGGKAVYQPEGLVYHIVEKNKMRKNYFRKLHFLEGERKGYLYIQKHSRNIMGVPPFIIIQFFKSILKYLKHAIINLHENSFRKEMNIWYFLGFIVGQVKAHRS